MNKFLRILLITLFLGIFLSVGSAMALDVDFTDVHYQAANNLTTFHSDKDNLRLNALAFPSDKSVRFTWTGDDGIGGGGTAGYEADEWELYSQCSSFKGDVLNISFDTSVLLTEIHLTDFFYEQRNGKWYEETGGVVFFDDNGSSLGGLNYFSQTDHSILPSNSNGKYIIDVASIMGSNALIKDVYLAGIGYVWDGCDRQDHEFAVAGLSTSPVPEPTTMLLLGAGLIGLAGFGRKKFKK